VSGLKPDEILKYLSIVQSLRQSFRFYDMHVHPYEIMFDKFNYNYNPSRPEILSMSGTSYKTPSITNFNFPETYNDPIFQEPSRLQNISLMQLRSTYNNVGEQVFIDQMDLGGIDKVLLLPVASDSGDIDSRMRWVKQFYTNEDRFQIGGSISGILCEDDLLPYVYAMKKKYDIKAMKCHPVVSGINLSVSDRKEWMEMLLVACHEMSLPLVLHTGRNTPYWGNERGNFGSLENLMTVNWSISKEPVVLAHAGFHRCSVSEVENILLPILHKMLAAHPNLYVDISCIGFETLKKVLCSVDIDRILFGSDALYVHQWAGVAMTMHAMSDLGMTLEESFVKIASINPCNIIFKDEKL
jgi:predicted TIM-barrel fold metal-dependent hydrolase